MSESRAALRARLLADAAHTGTLTALRLAVERFDLLQPRMPAFRSEPEEDAWVARQMEKRRAYIRSIAAKLGVSEAEALRAFGPTKETEPWP